MSMMIYAKEGYRMFRRSLRIRKLGYPRYEGNAEEICTQIVKNCWNGTYLQASTGNFPEFYMRDLGICADALLALGYEQEVYKTLQYCLNRYSTYERITTTITPDAVPVDVFRYAPDSLAFLLRTLRVAQADDLVKTYEPFLVEQAKLFKEKVIHSESGLVNLKPYSSMRDHSRRKSSCYDNCMAAMIKSELGRLGLENPLKQYDYSNIIKMNFWNGKAFHDELYSEQVSGDANVFPFWCGVFDDDDMARKAIASIRELRLDEPMPLRYQTGKLNGRSSVLTYFAPNYEGDTAWLHLGLCYMDIVSRFDKGLFSSYLGKYTALIEKEGNLVEVLNPDGTVYGNFWYAADDTLLWAAKYLQLRKVG
jgi:hypothetical protein